MTSPVNWAVLGLVIERPSYGYELVKRFERKYGDVLTLSSDSHIYTALNELARRGLVEQAPGTGTVQSGVGRQPKPHSRATAEGEHRYREWLIAQIHQDERRSRLFVRELAVLVRDPAAALDVIKRYEQACLGGSAKTPITSHEGSAADACSELIARLVSEENRLVAGAMLAWVEYARREFEALAHGRVQQQ
jgi:DNA-binding PadR family transcriptional regulator